MAVSDRFGVDSFEPKVSPWAASRPLSRLSPPQARVTAQACRSRRRAMSQCRICPSPRPFGLFAAEGLDQDPEAGGARQGRSPAGAGADRHRQHVRRAGILRQDGGLRHPADHRLRAGGRFRRSGPNARNALAAAPPRIVLLAARERGYRSLMRLNSRAFLETPVHQAPHIKFEWLQGEAEDLIALTGGPEGPISLAITADQAALAASRCDRLASLFGDRLYIELQRHGIDEGAPRRSRPDRSRLCQRLAAGRDQRALFCDRRRLRSA